MKQVVMFNPFTGSPRDPRDIQSDPYGQLIWDGETPLQAARAARPLTPTPVVDHKAGEVSDKPVEMQEPVALGDYVLATKWGDGDPGDPWAVGFYAGQSGDRHLVNDSTGASIRANGYRRVGRVTREVGAWLLSAAKELELSPPGAVNLWSMLYASPVRSDAWVAEAMLRADEYADEAALYQKRLDDPQSDPEMDLQQKDDTDAARAALEAWLKS